MQSSSNSYPWLTVGVVFIVLFFTSIEYSGVTVTLPSIANVFHMHLDLLTWVMNVFMLIMAIIIIPAGHIGDRYGRKLVFLLGVFLFSIGAFLVGLSTSSWFLLCGRIIQGLGSGIILPTAMSLAYMDFGVEDRAKVISVVVAGSFLGLAAGPLIAGLLVHYISWRWVFYINLPVGIIVLILTYLFVHESKHPEEGYRFDYIGFVLLTITLISTITALNYGEQWGWVSPSMIILYVVSFLSFALLILVDLRVRSPLLLLNLLLLTPYRIGLIGRIITNIVLVTLLFTSVLYLQNILNYSAEDTGYLLLAFIVPVSIVAFIVSRIAKRFSLKTLCFVGSIIAFVGLVLLSQLTLKSSLWVIIVFFAILGIGLGVTFPGYTSLAMGVLTQKKAAAGIGFLYLGILIANSLGVVIAGAVLQARGKSILVQNLAEQNISLSTNQLQNLLGVFSGKQTDLTNFSASVLDSTHQAFMSGYSLTMIVVAIFVAIGGLLTLKVSFP